MINLDTPVLLHAWAGRVSADEERALRSAPWCVAAIVLWEIAKLAQLGRISLDLEAPPVRAAIEAVHVWPIDLAVSLASTKLDFRSDPAGELIAATSVVHGVPLLTRDARIRGSRLVPLA